VSGELVDELGGEVGFFVFVMIGCGVWSDCGAVWGLGRGEGKGVFFYYPSQRDLFTSSHRQYYAKNTNATANHV
jgi:hypothetical protein